MGSRTHKKKRVNRTARRGPSTIDAVKEVIESRTTTGPKIPQNPLQEISVAKDGVVVRECFRINAQRARARIVAVCGRVPAP
uniref:Uncharacterized protein n=1 Tax=Anopheles quadriannulatus TaxID=34691 RepID=A0A182WTA7_ANOQN